MGYCWDCYWWRLLLLGWEIGYIFFFSGVVLGRCVSVEFFCVAFSTVCFLFRLCAISVGVSSEESLVEFFFFLLAFLGNVVSLSVGRISFGVGDCSILGMLGFLGVRALGESSFFGRCPHFFFFRVTWIHPFSVLRGFIPSTSGSFCDFLCAMSAFFGVFWGQDFAMWLICSQYQQCGRRPSITTICLSRQ